MTRIYISGPMAGFANRNYPAFHDSAGVWRGNGYDVVNPAEINADGGTRTECLRRDFAALTTCDAIFFLPGWEVSRGAITEWRIATALELEIHWHSDAVPATGSEIAHAVNVLVAACHGAASDAGWWKNKDGSDTRDNPLRFSNALMLIVSELAEAMEGDRKKLMDDHLPHLPMPVVELGDALIRICDLAGGYRMPLGRAVVEKLAYNAVRPDHKIEARNQDNGKAY